MNKFEELITKLGSLFNAPFHAEKETLCKLNIAGTRVQLEYDETKDTLLLASLLGELPPGKFREDALVAALKANHEDSSLGIFSYMEARNQLVLQSYLPLPSSCEELLQIVRQFTEKGKVWKEALEQGNLLAVTKTPSSSHISPLQFK